MISSIDAPSLDRLRLELVERFAHGRRSRPLELLAQPDHRPALLVVRRAELGRVPVDPRLDLCDRLLLPLRQVGELRLDVSLRSIEVVGDTLESLVEAALDVGERVCKRLPGPPLALDERCPTFLSEAALLGRQLRDRVGALAGERPPDLLGMQRRLLRDDCGDLGCAPPRRVPPSRSRACGRDEARARGRTRERARQPGTRRESRRPRRNAIGERDERGGDQNGRDREEPQGALRSGDEKLSRDRLTVAAREPDLPVDRDDLAASPPHRRRQPPLSQGERRRPPGGDERNEPRRSLDRPRIPVITGNAPHATANQTSE